MQRRKRKHANNLGNSYPCVKKENPKGLKENCKLVKLREGAEEAPMPTKGQPKEATTSEDNSGMTEAHSEAASNLASWLQLSLVNGQV